jgi:hypothetical protein
LEIVVLDKQSDKLIRMEVQPKHTIGAIIETIVDKQRMDKGQRYRLTLGNRLFGKEQYLLKVKDAGINQGDHLFLEAEIIAPEVVSKVEAIEREVEPVQVPKIEEKIPKPEKALSSPKFCLQCGKPLRAGRKFCLSCGAPTRA